MSRLPAVQMMQLLEKPGISSVKLSSKNSSVDGSVDFKRELEKAVNRIDERKGSEGERAFSSDSPGEVQGKEKAAEGASEKKDIKEAEFKGKLKSIGQGENARRGAEIKGAVGLPAGLGLMMQEAQPLEAGEVSLLTGNGSSASGGALPGAGKEETLKVFPGALMGIPLEVSSGKDASAAAVLPKASASAAGEVLEAESFLMVSDKGALESPGASLETPLEKAEGMLPLNKLELKAEGEKPGLKGAEKASAEGGVKVYSGTADKDAETFAKVLKAPNELSSGRAVNPGGTAKGTAAGGKASPEVSEAVLQKTLIVKDSVAAAEGPKSAPQGGFIERLSMILKEQMVQKSRFFASEGKSEVTLQLKPEYLGRLLVKLTLENNVFHARILAENSQVRQYIRDSLPQLKQSLEGQGISWQQAEVDVGGFEQWRPYEYEREGFFGGGSKKREGLVYEPEASAVEEIQHGTPPVGGTISYLA